MDSLPQLPEAITSSTSSLGFQPNPSTTSNAYANHGISLYPSLFLFGCIENSIPSLTLTFSSPHGIKGSSQQHFLSAPIHGRDTTLSPATHLLSLSLEHFLAVKSVNGLICLHFTNNLYSERADFPVFVFNSSTREIVTLPQDAPTDKKVAITYCFGYDPSSDEYKVLRICRFIDTKLEMSENSIAFKILTLGCEKWRQIKPIIPFFYNSCGAFFSSSSVSNGAIHWVIYKEKCILPFNLRDDQFTVFPYPDQSNEESAPYIDGYYLFEIRKRLAVLKISHVSCKIELWVMEDYPNKVWVKESGFRYHMTYNQIVPRLPVLFGTANEGDEMLFKSIGRSEDVPSVLL